MKNKILLTILIFIASSIIIGCSNNISSEDKVMDSVVIDEDAKETADSNNSISVNRLLLTENLNGDRKGAMLRADEKLIQIQYSEDFGEDEGAIYKTQFPNIYINNLEIGNITDDVQNNRNVVNWENKDINGQLLIEYMGAGDPFRIFKDNKVYTLDSNYNLKEITAYKKLIEDTNGNLNRFDTSYDGNLDIYYFDEGKGIEKIVIIDILNNKYHEINGKVLDSIKSGLRILMAEGDKIYVSVTDTTYDTISTIGYIENNKLTTFFDGKSTVKVKLKGDVLYSNNNILFSGYVEDSYGIWSYNIESKKLEKQVELKSDYSYFQVSKDKSFIIITNTNFLEDFSLSLARINDNLKISNIQELTNSILPNRSKNNGLSITGWSNNGNKFYVNYVKTKTVPGEEEIEDVYYEVYEVK